MRKLLSYLWLPIFAGVALLIIYGTLTIADLQLKNKKLETRITQLENNLGNTQVAASKEESSSGRSRILATSDQADNASTSISTPKPTPTPSFKKTSTPRPTSTSPAPMPTPTFITSPTPSPSPVAQTTVTIENIGTYSIILQTDDTAFSILLRAGQENSFSVEYQIYEGLGAFVNCIAGICAHDNYYWAFYYNGSYSMVGASLQEVLDGDTTAWKFESF